MVVHHARGEDLIEESLKSLEEEFASRFIRIHRNCLVARHELVELRRGSRQAGGAAAWQAAAGSEPPLRGDAEAGTAASVSGPAACGRDCCEATATATATATAGHGSLFYVLGRAGWVAGHAASTSPVSSMAPCSCALSCARGKSGAGRPANPPEACLGPMAPTVPPPHPGPTRPLSTASDSKSIGVIGGQIPFPAEKDLTPEAVGCCLCFFIFLDLPWLAHTETVKAAAAEYGVSAAWMPRPSPRDGFTASLHDPTAPAARLLL